jgi:hypothetical protein
MKELREKVLEFQGENDIGGGGNWGEATLHQDDNLVGFVWPTTFGSGASRTRDAVIGRGRALMRFHPAQTNAEALERLSEAFQTLHAEERHPPYRDTMESPKG